jgi:hypothetical protein
VDLELKESIASGQRYELPRMLLDLADFRIGLPKFNEGESAEEAEVAKWTCPLN